MADDRLPLSTLLSWALVAFTIEFDNEFEHRMPHRTTRHRGAPPSGRVWLVSQAMWSNFMRFLPAEGLTLGVLDHAAQLTNLNGLHRWGYVEVDPDTGGPGINLNGPGQLIRPTEAGQLAQRMWSPVAGIVQDRWSDRFGPEVLDALMVSLTGIAARSGRTFPDYLPVIGPTNGGRTRLPEGLHLPPPAMAGHQPRPELSVLLSRVLLDITLEFEQVSRLSLPIGANTLRVLTTEGVRIRDLPVRTGVSKEANAMATGFLERRGCVSVEPDPSASRGKVARLTTKGRIAQERFQERLQTTEATWSGTHGPGDVLALRSALEAIVSAGSPTAPRLWEGLIPYADGWRASVRTPEVLPHYPMVLHRGGFPDGS
jgi:DNA-binding MarR family transcriptional regulator